MFIERRGKREGEEARKRGSEEAGKRGSEEAGKRGSGEARKRGSEEAGKRGSGEAGKRGSGEARKRGSEEAGKPENESLAPEGRYVYRTATGPRNQSPRGATCDKFGDNRGRGRTGKREDGKEGSSLLPPLACPRGSRDQGGGTQGGKNFAPLRYFSRVYNSLFLQHFDFLCERFGFLCERFNLPFE